MMEYGRNDGLCDQYEDDVLRLIDCLIKDTQKLELKVVYLRYLLSGYLSAHKGSMLKYEIFSDLASRYGDNPVYQQYVSSYCGGQDPMEYVHFNEHMRKVSCGEESLDL
jgi:hypothetical protein